MRSQAQADVLPSGYLPELGQLIPGKVRDNHVVGDTRVLVATDRISAFDRVLDALIPEKGAVLNAIAMWWFEQTEDIVSNHIVDWPDPNVLVARQVPVIPIELVVRGYLTGSAWQDVQADEFESKYGYPITPEMIEGGKLVRNCELKEPIVTPTTKAQTGHDAPLTPERAREIAGERYDEMVEVALKLYERGAKLARERGLLLVDTKYEFGTYADELILVDEIHTPDSSRYWYADDFGLDKTMEELSKQFVRDIVQRSELTERGVQETSRRYIELYERLTGRTWERHDEKTPIRQRVVNNMVRRGHLKGGYVQIVAGSENDAWHVKELAGELKALGIPHAHQVASAHKNTRQVLGLVETLNRSIEPVVAITVAGESDALSGVVAHHARFPVIACPPYKDRLDYVINVHSTLLMPSRVPVVFCKRPGNAVLAAERILENHNPLFAQRNR